MQYNPSYLGGILKAKTPVSGHLTTDAGAKEHSTEANKLYLLARPETKEATPRRRIVEIVEVRVPH